MRAALYEAGQARPGPRRRRHRRPGPGPGAGARCTTAGSATPTTPCCTAPYGASPSVLGHEAAGVVDAVGEGVTMVAPGDKVVLTPIAPCGRCYWCQRDQPGCCVNNSAVLGGAFLDGSTGLSRGGQQVYRGLGVGGFAEYAMTNETGAVKVPADTPLETACVIGCAVQTGVGAVLNTAKVEPGATVLVLGLGGIGLSVVQGARAAGAAQIIASDPLDWRREAATAHGRDHRARSRRRRRRRRHPRPHRRRRRLRVRVRGRRRPRRGRRRGHPGRRLDRARRARRRSTGKLELDPLVLFGISREEAHGLLPRQLQLAARHPPHGRHVAGRASSTSRPWSPPTARSTRSTRPSPTSPPASASAPSSTWCEPCPRGGWPIASDPSGATLPSPQASRPQRKPSGLGESPDRRWPGGVPLVIMGGITTWEPASPRQPAVWSTRSEAGADGESPDGRGRRPRPTAPSCAAPSASAPRTLDPEATRGDGAARQVAADAELMGRALARARRARRRTAPNPWVGAVVVRDGEIVGEGATAAARRRPRRDRGPARRRRPRPRRHRVHHARAVRAPGPHRPVRRRARSRPASPAWSSRSRIPTRRCAGRASPSLRDRGHHRRRRDRRRRRRRARSRRTSHHRRTGRAFAW